MLGFLCCRPKPLLFPPAVASSFLLHRFLAPAPHRLLPSSTSFPISPHSQRGHHSTSCLLRTTNGGAAASIWHGILPSSAVNPIHSRRAIVGRAVREDGSWNVVWDARPARWLHGSDSAWLLFGVCSCFQHYLLPAAIDDATAPPIQNDDDGERERHAILSHAADTPEKPSGTTGYRVTGVSGDGRCLFRAVAYGDCRRDGKEAPDETQQRELADDLRARVAKELLKRREETEWFIEGDFESYVKNIQQLHTWGGEPELLMASHVLQKPISVFMMDGRSGDLRTIASHGQEYHEGKNNPITVLFHGYGHYDALEVF